MHELKRRGVHAKELCCKLGVCDRVCRIILSMFHRKHNFSSSLMATFWSVYVNNFYLIFSSLFRSLSDDKCVRSQKENHHLCLSRHQLLLASRYRFLLLHDYCSNCSGLVILSTKWVFEYMSIQQLLRKLVLNLSLGFTDLPQNTDRIVFLMNQTVLLLAYYH